MSDNTKTSSQRLKILYLYKILLDKTDELHPLSMPEIITELECCGISAGRKALYEDIEALKTYGVDIVTIKGKSSGYYVGARDFELPELKLLADAVSSSRFLTEKKSSELIKKIESLSSVHEAKQIHRQLYIANRVKAMNERIYMNVDVINRAIEAGKQITFRYFDFDVNKTKHYREGRRICHPYALAWEEERYYLIAFYEKYDCISNFRIDRMESVEILSDPVKKKPADFDVAEYMNSTFSMFSGEKRSVKLRFENRLVNPVIDRFGKDAPIIPDSNDHFTVRVNVKPTVPFFAWLFQFGEQVRIIEPHEIKEKYIEQLKKVLRVTTENKLEEN